MPRYKLTIAYDGRPFNGWQSQACGNTVQDHLVKALATVAKQPLKLQGSGRTDTGVHALAQVAHFDAPDDLSMNPHNWVPALNTKLPATIRVMATFWPSQSTIAKSFAWPRRRVDRPVPQCSCSVIFAPLRLTKGSTNH